MILQPQDATIAYPVADMANAWCAYEHVMHQPGQEQTSVVYISWCKLHEVYNLTYASRNSEWVKLATPGTYIYVRIIAIGGEADCRNLAIRKTRETSPMPVCNLKGVDMTLTSRRLGCSNGEEYESQTDAARILGVPQSMISQQLAGKLKHVKGLKFWRLQ